MSQKPTDQKDSQPMPIVKGMTLTVTCSACGGGLSYEAGRASMTCTFCDHEVALPDKPVLGDSLERDLKELLEQTHKDGLPGQKVLACRKCGATTTVEGQRISGRCAFCGSHLVEERDSQTDRVRPTALIPFQVERDKATEMFRKWTGSLWLRPTSLKTLAKVAAIEGVYTPFWTFDAKARSEWEAERGDYYSTGGSDSEQKVRWTPVSGIHETTYDDILICGSQGLSADLVRRIEPFNTRDGLVAYKPDFLSGWAAEQYQVAPKESWNQGKKEILDREQIGCENAVPGDIHRGLKVFTDYSEVTWKHVLLPVWIAAYEYRGQSYRFLVNGETGRVSGEAPYSWWKIGGLVVSVFLTIYLLLTLMNDGTQSPSDVLNDTLMYSGYLAAAGGFRYLISVRNSTVLKLREFYRQFQ